MGDISEIRGLVVVGTFISSLIFLMILFPSNFFTTGADAYRVIEPPPYFEAIDMQSFADTKNFSMTFPSYPYLNNTGYVDFGGWVFDQYWLYGTPLGTVNNTWVNRYDSFWIFTWYVESAHFYHNGFDVTTIIGDFPRLTLDTLDLHYNADGLNGLNYIAKFGSTTQFYLFFSFNETTYGNPSEAYGNSELYILWGIEFDQIQTTFNAWAIISMILFFGLPNVHWVIDFLIHIPIWIAEVYISYILILRAIGAIFGGGGA